MYITKLCFSQAKLQGDDKMLGKVNDIMAKKYTTQEEYEFVIKKYSKIINTIVWKMTNFSDEDMSQEMMLNFIKVIPKFDPSKNVKFVTWAKIVLDRIAWRYLYEKKYNDGRLSERHTRNLNKLSCKEFSGDLTEKEKLELLKLRSLSEYEEYHVEEYNNYDCVNENYIIIKDEIDRFIKTLSEKDRCVLDLTIKGYVLEEIGIKLGFSKQFASMRLISIRKRLDKFLKKIDK